VICPVNYRQSEAVRQVADRLHGDLEAAGLDVIIDDRGERPGSMFADWELIGIPHRITVGERGLKNGQVEYAQRRGLQADAVSIADAVGLVAQRIAAGRS
jgi:prolyl-tRNA synthetase